jgi:hypothetical protein
MGAPKIYMCTSISLGQIEPWIGLFFTLKKNIFSYNIVCVFKGVAFNSSVQYKKCAIDMWKD